MKIADYFCFLILFFGMVMAEVFFLNMEKLYADNKYASLEYRFSSGFHFLGLLLMVIGLLEAYSKAKKEIKRRKKRIFSEM